MAITTAQDKPESMLLRLRKTDTPTSVSVTTVDLLEQQMGMNRTDLIHFALRQLADRFLPKYELDDGPLTDAQISAIRAASPATNIPEERFTKGLF
ncbi:hypothetical protein ACIPL1_27780 [Pseudomonas sp. NPDC090202]|uniref:hypothetical protein n=1 Tax=Pseudomonas sp. NPDC090202 TaxID=3364476 RepID=UPI003803EE61